MVIALILRFARSAFIQNTSHFTLHTGFQLSLSNKQKHERHFPARLFTATSSHCSFPQDAVCYAQRRPGSPRGRRELWRFIKCWRNRKLSEGCFRAPLSVLRRRHICMDINALIWSQSTVNKQYS